LISFIAQGISLFMVAAFIRTAEISSDPERSRRLGVGAACMVFIFLFLFTLFNIIPCWLYGSEIQPQEVRARGYSFTILGWAVGCGMNTFVIPIMLNRLGWKTFIIFGVFNILALPVIYFLYPEVAGRSLEEINLLFTSNSLLAQKNVARYHRLIDEAGGNVAVAARRFLDSVDAEYNQSLETGVIVEEEEGKTDSGHVEEKSASSFEASNLRAERLKR
jgi:MFS family permease